MLMMCLEGDMTEYTYGPYGFQNFPYAEISDHLSLWYSAGTQLAEETRWLPNRMKQDGEDYNDLVQDIKELIL